MVDSIVSFFLSLLLSSLIPLFYPVWHIRSFSVSPTVMNSLTAYFRLLLLLLLPSAIIFSLLYHVAPSSSPAATTTLSPLPVRILSDRLSSSTPSPSKAMTDTTATPKKPTKCHPFKIPDSRPFFEREPLQSNLPRPAVESTHFGLRRRLSSLRLAVVACAFNVEKDVEKFRGHVEPIVDLFHSTSRILILESDSTDNTLAKLRQWPRAEVYTYGNLSIPIPRRTERIAFCRNELLIKARRIQPDYMLVLDLDIFATNVTSFLSNFDYNSEDWSVMTANLIQSYYYDIWALRTLSESILNYDVWHRIWAMGFVDKYCMDTVIKNVVDIHKKPYPMERGLLEVRSAFGGAGLYKMEATEGCVYSGDFHTCEHAPFHVCMREKNQARIFINPRFTQ